MDSQTSVSKFVFFATLLSLCFVCYGFNVNRFEESSIEGQKSVNSIFGDLIKLLRNKNLTAVPMVVPDIQYFVKSLFLSAGNMTKVLAQYPDTFNKTFSKVEEKDGKQIVTNTTIYKNKSNSSGSEMYIQEQTIDGKDSFLHAQIKLPPIVLNSTTATEAP